MNDAYLLRDGETQDEDADVSRNARPREPFTYMRKMREVALRSGQRIIGTIALGTRRIQRRGKGCGEGKKTKKKPKKTKDRSTTPAPPPGRLPLSNKGSVALRVAGLPILGTGLPGPASGSSVFAVPPLTDSSKFSPAWLAVTLTS